VQRGHLCSQRPARRSTSSWRASILAGRAAAVLPPGGARSDLRRLGARPAPPLPDLLRTCVFGGREPGGRGHGLNLGCGPEEALQVRRNSCGSAISPPPLLPTSSARRLASCSKDPRSTSGTPDRFFSLAVRARNGDPCLGGNSLRDARSGRLRFAGLGRRLRGRSALKRGRTRSVRSR